MVLLLPGFLYIAVNKFGSNEYISLPVYGEKKLSGEMKRNWGREYPDTIFHTLNAVDFYNYNGEICSFLKADTVISVAHLFYTKDQAFSRLMLDHMGALADRFKANEHVRLFSISVDPQESEQTLQAFLKPYKHIASTNWEVVYGASTDIFAYAREELLIDAMVNPADSTSYIIGNQLVLLDSKKRLRGFYDVSLKGEVDRLEDEIKLLMVEEVRNRPLKIEKQ